VQIDIYGSGTTDSGFMGRKPIEVNDELLV